MGPQVERFDVFEVALEGPSTGNPFRDVSLDGEVRARQPAGRGAGIL